jgi:outer membrane protein
MNLRLSTAVAAALAVIASTRALAQDGDALKSNSVLKLDDAETAAKLHQPQILQAHANTEAADARAGEQRAGLLPQVSGAVTYQRTTGNNVPRGYSGTTTTTTGSNGNTSTTNTWATFNAFSGSLVAQQLLWDFNQTHGRYKSAQALSQSAFLSERATQLNIVLNVRTAFFSARANRALAEVARATVANDKRHLEQIQGFVTAGIRSEIDLAQTRTDLANAQLSQVTYENNYETAKQQLNLAMGVTTEADFEVADDSLPPVAGETDSALKPLIDQALKDRPEMLAFEQQVRAQQETISSVKGAYGPTIAAQAGISQGGEAIDSLAWNAYVGVNLAWNIFQGGLTNATVREAEANLRAIAAQRAGEAQQIASDVNIARLAVRAGLASQVAAQAVLKSSKDLLRLAEGQYQTGIGSIIQLSDAQVAGSMAEAQVIQADFTLATARAQLLKALGRP